MFLINYGRQEGGSKVLLDVPAIAPNHLGRGERILPSLLPQSGFQLGVLGVGSLDAGLRIRLLKLLSTLKPQGELSIRKPFLPEL